MLLYGLCWAPIKLFQFLLDYGIISYCTEREMYTWIGIYFVCHWTAMSNSFVNPIVYSFMSSSFRVSFVYYTTKKFPVFYIFSIVQFFIFLYLTKNIYRMIYKRYSNHCELVVLVRFVIIQSKPYLLKCKYIYCPNYL